MNKDIIPIDGSAVVNDAYKLWKKHHMKQQKPQHTSQNWTRLSKAEVNSPKPVDAIRVNTQTADPASRERLKA